MQSGASQGALSEFMEQRRVGGQLRDPSQGQRGEVGGLGCLIYRPLLLQTDV